MDTISSARSAKGNQCMLLVVELTLLCVRYFSELHNFSVSAVLLFSHCGLELFVAIIHHPLVHANNDEKAATC